MRALGWIGVAVLVLLALVTMLFVRRAVLIRAGGTIRLNVRVSTLLLHRGWSPGFGRFVNDELRWYRMFSLSFRPKRVLSRRGLTVERRRAPEGQELLVMPADWVIVRCVGHQAPIEIAMAQATLAGFLSWLEAAPPGAASPYLAEDWPAA
ncbi:MAG: DUF2550 domain-containing protein [Actinobacteria bacterium]|nr:MAG: DUF2550 domain-containing protein [Actinomycetota bacterium]